MDYKHGSTWNLRPSNRVAELEWSRRSRRSHEHAEVAHCFNLLSNLARCSPAFYGFLRCWNKSQQLASPANSL